MTTLRSDTIFGNNDDGPVLDGVLKYTSENYMTLPKGTTADAFPSFKGAPASSARGIFAGGVAEPSPTRYDTIDYVQIATTGNATDFGNLLTINQFPGALASSTRGVIVGGFWPALVNTMQYVTIATTGNAKDFGDLLTAKNQPGACSNSTRGLIAGGNPETDTVEYIQIQSTGNSLDFGCLLYTSPSPRDRG